MKITIDITEKELNEVEYLLDRSNDYELYCGFYNKLSEAWNKKILVVDKQ